MFVCHHKQIILTCLNHSLRMIACWAINIWCHKINTPLDSTASQHCGSLAQFVYDRIGLSIINEQKFGHPATNEKYHRLSSTQQAYIVYLPLYHKGKWPNNQYKPTGTDSRQLIRCRHLKTIGSVLKNISKWRFKT